MDRTAADTLVTARLAALGEMIRLRLLRLLEEEELSVGELARVVQLPQSTVSRHLKVLADGEWLFKRSEGTATLYRLVLDDMDANARALWLAVRAQMSPDHSPELAEDTRRLESVLAERRTDSQSFFGRVVGEWDDLRNDLFGDRATFQAMLSLLPRDWTVADLGCGTGNAAELLAANVARVIAVDQSAPMIKAAKKRLAGCDNVDFRRGDLDALPLSAGEVDAAVCVLVLHHVADPSAACAEIHRTVRPGGVVLIVDMVEHERASYRHTMGHRWLGFSRSAIERLLTQAGFRNPKYQELRSHPEAKGPGLFACTAFAGSDAGRKVPE
ncbi:MAG: ArsR family transcriptional regulator [Phycisphaeraceae bacterium]|nr:ArsR family transcriptional regulator [Phycisphaeraceae bacterium]